MAFTGACHILIFNDLFVYTNIKKIVRHIVRQQCLCKQQKPKGTEVLRVCAPLSIQHNQTCERANHNMNYQQGACPDNDQYLNQ
jgi:hypothetical protein